MQQTLQHHLPGFPKPFRENPHRKQIPGGYLGARLEDDASRLLSKNSQLFALRSFICMSAKAGPLSSVSSCLRPHLLLEGLSKGAATMQTANSSGHTLRTPETHRQRVLTPLLCSSGGLIMQTACTSAEVLVQSVEVLWLYLFCCSLLPCCINPLLSFQREITWPASPMHTCFSFVTSPSTTFPPVRVHLFAGSSSACCIIFLSFQQRLYLSACVYDRLLVFWDPPLSPFDFVWLPPS